MSDSNGEHYETIVIGGGQTGLTVGRELSIRNREFIILDASERVGDPWRKRWGSLRLFTPVRFSGLPDIPFPGKRDDYPDKDQVADYLESYASEMNFPIRSGVRVDRLGHDGVRFVLDAGGEKFTADSVVVAMANQAPRVPEFAPDLDPDVVQLHSSAYRNPSQLQEGPVLVVGLGNSGADIGLEVAATHQTFVSGEPTAVIPIRIEKWFGRKIGVFIARFLFTKVLSTSTPVGRKALPKMRGHAAPLVRVRPSDLTAAGVERVARVVGVTGGQPVLEGGRVMDVANVIWCTGFSSGFPSWVDLPVLNDDGLPRHQRGVVAEQPGLFFVGLDFLHSAWSETLPGMPADARHVVEQLVSRSARSSVPA